MIAIAIVHDLKGHRWYIVLAPILFLSHVTLSVLSQAKLVGSFSPSLLYVLDTSVGRHILRPIMQS